MTLCAGVAVVGGCERGGEARGGQPGERVEGKDTLRVWRLDSSLLGPCLEDWNILLSENIGILNKPGKRVEGKDTPQAWTRLYDLGIWKLKRLQVFKWNTFYSELFALHVYSIF